MDNNKKIVRTLDNGIRVLIVPLNTKLTNVSVSILLGKNHEKYKERELTHYMEHLMGRFTSKKYKDVKFIKEELDKRGANTNAFVSDYETNFYINGQYTDIEFYVDLLSNNLKEFYIDKSLFIQEKNAVIQELQNNMSYYEYNFDKKIFKYMFPKLFYQVDLQNRINNIKKYNIKNLYNYIKKHIILNNIIINVSCPNGKAREAFKIVDKYFNFQKPKKKQKLLKYPVFKYDNDNIKIIHINNNNKKINNAVLRIYVNDDIKYNTNEHFALLYLKNILFNFQTGIFYKYLRDKLGLVYSVRFNIDIDLQNSVSSMYNIETSANYNSIPKLVETMLYIIENLTLTDDEINNGRKILIIKNENQIFENLTSFNRYYGLYMLHKKPIIDKKDIHKKIINLGNDYIRKVLCKFKKNILNKGLIFYYSKDNKNEDIKKILVNKHKNIKYLAL
jgi:predicted Zn-dependent peptidase